MMEKYRLRDYPDRKNDIFGISNKNLGNHILQRESDNRGKLRDNIGICLYLPKRDKNFKSLLSPNFIDEQEVQGDSKGDSKLFYYPPDNKITASTIKRGVREFAGGQGDSKDSKIGQPSSLFFFHSLRKQNTVHTVTQANFLVAEGWVTVKKSEKFYCHPRPLQTPLSSSLSVWVTVRVTVKSQIYIIPYYNTLNHIVYIIVYHLVRLINNG